MTIDQRPIWVLFIDDGFLKGFGQETRAKRHMWDCLLMQNNYDVISREVNIYK